MELVGSFEINLFSRGCARMASYLRKIVDYVTGADSLPQRPDQNPTGEKRKRQANQGAPAPIIVEAPKGDGGTQARTTA